MVYGASVSIAVPVTVGSQLVLIPLVKSSRDVWNSIEVKCAPTDAESPMNTDHHHHHSLAGIHAWQALEIIFLVLTTATLIILIFSLIFYRYRRSIHYYLIFLGAFCIWPAGEIDFNIDLEVLVPAFSFSLHWYCPLVCLWFCCFQRRTRQKRFRMVFLSQSRCCGPFSDSCRAAFHLRCSFQTTCGVIDTHMRKLFFDHGILLRFRRAINDDDDAVIERFPDLNGYPDGLNPSTYVIVRRNRKKRNKPYEYPTVLYPSTAPTPASVPNGKIPQTPQAPLTPYTSIVTTQETTTTAAPVQPPMTSASTRHVFTNNRPDLVPSASLATFEPPITSYRTPVPLSAYPSNYSSPSLPPAPPVWNPNGITTVTRSYAYPSEPMNSAYPRSNYYPPRMPVAESRSEPRVLHYYTGYDYFATIDPSDAILTRNPPPLTRPGTAVRYNNNLTYYPTNDYVKSTM